MEVAEPKRRLSLGFTIYVVWGVNLGAWGGLGYLLREWRLLQFVGSLPGLVFLPLMWWVHGEMTRELTTLITKGCLE